MDALVARVLAQVVAALPTRATAPPTTPPVAAERSTEGAAVDLSLAAAAERARAATGARADADTIGRDAAARTAALVAREHADEVSELRAALAAAGAPSAPAPAETARPRCRYGVACRWGPARCLFRH